MSVKPPTHVCVCMRPNIYTVLLRAPGTVCHMSFVYTPYSFDVWEMYVWLYESVRRLRDLRSTQFSHRHAPDIAREVGGMRPTEAPRHAELRPRGWSNHARVHPSRDYANNPYNAGRGLAPHQRASYYQSGQTQ
jgi:hypothetical protein